MEQDTDVCVIVAVQLVQFVRVCTCLYMCVRCLRTCMQLCVVLSPFTLFCCTELSSW